jgi:hypothetical protein
MAAGVQHYQQRIQTLQQKIKKPGQQQNAQQKLQAVKQKLAQAKKAQGGGGAYPAGYEHQIPFYAPSATSAAQAGLEYSLAQNDISTQQGFLSQQEGLLGQDKELAGKQHELNVGYLGHQAGAQQNRTLNSYARTGQLYAGALEDARAADKYYAEHAMSEEDLSYKSSLLDAERSAISLAQQQAALSSQGQYAAMDYAGALTAAEQEALEAGLAAYPDPSLAPGGGGGGGGKKPPQPGPNFRW